MTTRTRRWASARRSEQTSTNRKISAPSNSERGIIQKRLQIIVDSNKSDKEKVKS